MQFKECSEKNINYEHDETSLIKLYDLGSFVVHIINQNVQKHMHVKPHI